MCTGQQGCAAGAASLLLAGALVAGTAGVSSAQPVVVSPPASLAQAPAPPASPRKPVVERIESGFVLAPEVRVTEIDDRTATLVGGYGGWLTDRTILIGAGGYWLANGDGRELAYGGAVVEWAVRGRERIGFAVRGLVGVGRATLESSLFGDLGDRDIDVPRLFGRFGRRGQSFGHGGDLRIPVVGGSGFTVRVEDTFLVAEPQVTFIWNAADWMRLNIGAGYRVVGATDWFGDRLNGASGSVSVQFGGGGY
jgi:hypothetical protein